MSAENIFERRILIAGFDETTRNDLRELLEGTDGGRECTDDASSGMEDTALSANELEPQTLNRVEVASNNRSAIDSVRSSLFDSAPFAVAFIEAANQSDWDGLEVIRSIWDLDQEIQVVVYSSQHEVNWSDIVYQLGGNDRFLCVQRPFDRAHINQVVRSLTAKWLVSTTDSLTGIPNRRCFMEHFSREWSRSIRHHMPLTCAVLDLDFFKRINDTYGHAVGDQVLISVAKELRKSCRIGDFVSRLGGEEFAVLLPETSEGDSQIWSDKIRDRISKMEIEGLDKTFDLTVSIGLAERHSDCESIEEMLDQADQAMLVAKNSGRNRSITHSSQRDGRESSSEHPLDHLTARDIMTAPVYCLRVTDTVKHAADLFLTLRINSVPIVNSDERLVGIVSEKDLITSISQGKNTEDPLSDLMTKSVVRFEEETSAKEIHDFLGRANIRRIVVVRDGVPSGVISRGTVLRWYQSLSQIETNSIFRSSLGGICLDPEERISHARQIARALSHHAAKLEARLDEEDCNLVPLIVGGASDLQQLVGDMLAYSQYASAPQTVC